MRKVYVLVEGHGEVEAVGNLLARLADALALPLRFARPIRWKNLHLRDGILRGAEYIRARGDAHGLLVLRDEDDHERCPRITGPESAEWLRSAQLPFAAATVLFKPEYEVLFLPCLGRMAGVRLAGPGGGRSGLRAGTRWDGPWEKRRDVKGWLTAHYDAGRAYKPTTDQLALTKLIHFDDVRASGLPCFGTLERALHFLASAGSGEVSPRYRVPATPSA